jgi:tight adherence protein B
MHVGLSLLSLVMFAAVTVGLAAGGYALSALLRDSSRVRQRVDDEFRKGQDESAGRSALFKNLDEFDLDRLAAGARFDPAEASPAPRAPRGLRGRLGVLLEQADLRMAPDQLLGLTAGLGLALGLLGVLFRGPLLGVPLAAGGAASPLLWVHLKRKARRERLLAQLPGAFDLMSRVLRAGQSVPQALQAVADAFEPPIAGEFAGCQKRQSLGLRPEVTFREMAERTGILEMRIFVMAMLIQRQAGGNLSEVLDRLSAMIRDRIRIRRQVKTLTAEGRLQGLTLVVLPMLMFGVMMVINRKYAEVLLEHTSLLAATGVSMGVGVLWIRRIVNFEV